MKIKITSVVDFDDFSDRLVGKIIDCESVDLKPVYEPANTSGGIFQETYVHGHVCLNSRLVIDTKNGRRKTFSPGQTIWFAGIQYEIMEEGDQMNKQSIVKPKQLFFNPPHTVVLWSDGVKTKVRCTKEDQFTEEVGFAMAVLKRMYGNNHKGRMKYMKLLKKANRHKGRKK